MTPGAMPQGRPPDTPDGNPPAASPALARSRVSGSLPPSTLDAALASVLAAVTLATRAAVRTTSYHSLDSGYLAAAMHRYDFSSHQPHAPYYPLVVAAGRLLAPWVEGGALGALTWLAIAASGLMVAGTYLLARRFADRATAMLASLLLVLSPIALRNGAVPLSYSLEGAAAVAVAWAAWSCRQAPTRNHALALGAVTAIAVGIRPSALLLLAPLGLWAAWPRRSRHGEHGARWTLRCRFAPLAWTALSGTTVGLAWLVPAIWAGGGWQDFAYGMRFQSQQFVFVHPVWVGGATAITNHVAWLAHHARVELPFLAATAFVAAVASLRMRAAWPRHAAPMVAVWVLPGIAFYFLVYAGWPVYPDGYLMALLPGVAIACACTLRGAYAAIATGAVPAGARAVGGLVVVSLLVLPVAWAGSWDSAMRPAREAESWEASMAGLGQVFPANETAFVTYYAGPWLRIEHPQHLVFVVEVFATGGLLHTQVSQNRGMHVDQGYLDGRRDGARDEPNPVPPWVRRIALVQGHPLEPSISLVRDGVALHWQSVPGGGSVAWLDATGVQTIEEVLSFTQGSPIPYERFEWPP